VEDRIKMINPAPRFILKENLELIKKYSTSPLKKPANNLMLKKTKSL
jgi:hypothetical protein